MRILIAPVKMLFVALALLSLAGCAATVTMAPPAEDAAAKQFAPASNQANIYVAREDKFTGSAVAFEFLLDGRGAGSLAPGTFLLLEVEPGEHVLSSTGAENQEVVRLTAEAGKNYFYQVEPKMGWVKARLAITQLDDDAGRALVLQTSLAQDLQLNR